ncbi:hypothetical protein KM1_029200 [Entamoeba histolytica HM-3:IMSS]|uniref:Uncharacterized protein n=1 Tax=Entamoeba histolytica HM-3:IMSS TaxID=885315 RepID=M7X3T0_ENTHI|nr:hypothetical protein KM1_029200 [Entamoeba histolytica HM-3:IMSS]
MQRKTKFQTRNVRVHGSLSQQSILMETYNDITKVPPKKETLQEIFNGEKVKFIISDNSSNQLMRLICFDGDVLIPMEIVNEIFRSERIYEKNPFLKVEKKVVVMLIQAVLFNRKYNFNEMKTSEIIQFISSLPFVKIIREKNLISSLVSCIEQKQLYFEEEIEMHMVKGLIEMNDIDKIRIVAKSFKTPTAIKKIYSFLYTLNQINIPSISNEHLFLIGQMAIEKKDMKMFRGFIKEQNERKISSSGIFLWKMWNINENSIQQGLFDLFIQTLQIFKNEENDMYFLITIEEVILHEEYLPYLYSIINQVILILDTRCTITNLYHCIKIISHFSGTEKSNDLIIKNHWYELIIKRITGKLELAPIALPLLINILSSFHCCQNQQLDLNSFYSSRQTYQLSNLQSQSQCLINNSHIEEVLLCYLTQSKDNPSMILSILQAFDMVFHHKAVDISFSNFILPALISLCDVFENETLIINRSLNLFFQVELNLQSSISETLLLHLKDIAIKYIDQGDIIEIISRILFICVTQDSHIATNNNNIISLITTILKTYTNSPQIIMSTIKTISFLCSRNMSSNYFQQEGTSLDVSIALKMALDDFDKYKDQIFFENFVEECSFILGLTASVCEDIDTLENWLALVKDVSSYFPNSIKAKESGNVISVEINERLPSNMTRNERKNSQLIHSLLKQSGNKSSVQIFKIINENVQLLNEEITKLVSICNDFISSKTLHKTICLIALINALKQTDIAQNLALELTKTKFLDRANKNEGSSRYKIHLYILQLIIQSYSNSLCIEQELFVLYDLFKSDRTIEELLNKSKNLTSFYSSLQTIKSQESINSFLMLLPFQSFSNKSLIDTYLSYYIKLLNVSIERVFSSEKINEDLILSFLLCGIILAPAYVLIYQNLIIHLTTLIIGRLQQKQVVQEDIFLVLSLLSLSSSSYVKQSFKSHKDLECLYNFFDGCHDLRSVEIAKKLIEKFSS